MRRAGDAQISSGHRIAQFAGRSNKRTPQTSWLKGPRETRPGSERFIRTLQDGWAYGAIYRSSHERTAALDGWSYS
jgi:hypothetical protein